MLEQTLLHDRPGWQVGERCVEFSQEGSLVFSGKGAIQEVIDAFVEEFSPTGFLGARVDGKEQALIRFRGTIIARCIADHQHTV